MIKASIICILFAQLLMTFCFLLVLPEISRGLYSHQVNWGVCYPSSTQFAMAFSSSPSAVVHVIPLILSSILGLYLLFFSRKRPERDYIRSILLMLAFAVMQIAIGGSCAFFMIYFYAVPIK